MLAWEPQVDLMNGIVHLPDSKMVNGIADMPMTTAARKAFTSRMKHFALRELRHTFATRLRASAPGVWADHFVTQMLGQGDSYDARGAREARPASERTDRNFLDGQGQLKGPF